MHAVETRQLAYTGPVCPCPPSRKNDSVGQLRSRVIFSDSDSLAVVLSTTTPIPVGHVVGVRSRVQVLRVYTSPDITVMKNLQSVRYLAYVQLISNPMSTREPTAVTEATVAPRRYGSPEPAARATIEL